MRKNTKKILKPANINVVSVPVSVRERSSTSVTKSSRLIESPTSMVKYGFDCYREYNTNSFVKKLTGLVN